MRSGNGSPASKKPRRISESSEESDVEEQYAEWRSQVFEKYNSIKKRSLINSIDTLKTVMKPKKYSHVNECKKNSDCSSSMWSTSAYILKHIRLCVLGHKWNLLRNLVLALTKHDKKYHCYLKEMSFHVARMAGMEDRTVFRELEYCFTKDDVVKENRFDIWYIE